MGVKGCGDVWLGDVVRAVCGGVCGDVMWHGVRRGAWRDVMWRGARRGLRGRGAAMWRGVRRAIAVSFGQQRKDTGE